MARKASTTPRKRRTPQPALSATAAVRKAFGSTTKTIDDVMASLARSGHKLTERQVRAALDRVKAAGGTVTNEGRRAFSVRA